jgi:hypothetical protein
MKNLNRREFILKNLAPVAGMAILGGLLSGCKKSDQKETTEKTVTDEDPCNDLSQLTEEEKAIREELEYVAKSPFPEKVCDNCAVWIKPEEGKLCGGCEIMAGPVNPKGHCASWVETEEV